LRLGTGFIKPLTKGSKISRFAFLGFIVGLESPQKILRGDQKAIVGAHSALKGWPGSYERF